jgi:hypothetical protein
MKKETTNSLLTVPKDNVLQFNQPVRPFSISFYNKEKTVEITIQNVKDVFKIAEAYKIFLDEIEVPYIVTEKNNNEF